MDLKHLYLNPETYNSDWFEILFFRKGKGSLILNQKKIEIKDNTIVFISKFQRREWKLESEDQDFSFLFFQEDFLNDFFADKLFTYKLLYFYQLDYPLALTVTDDEIAKITQALAEIKTELKHSKFDSEHIIRSLLYYLLLKLNRQYAQEYHIPLEKPNNNYAYQYRKLLDMHVCAKQRIEDYTSMLGISRITLNKAIQAQFNVTASHLLKQRLLFEIKNELIYSDLTIAQIADKLNFSEPNHLMRFFKTQTGITTSEFISDYQNGISST